MDETVREGNQPRSQPWLVGWKHSKEEEGVLLAREPTVLDDAVEEALLRWSELCW